MSEESSGSMRLLAEEINNEFYQNDNPAAVTLVRDAVRAYEDEWNAYETQMKEFRQRLVDAIRASPYQDQPPPDDSPKVRASFADPNGDRPSTVCMNGTYYRWVAEPFTGDNSDHTEHRVVENRGKLFSNKTSDVSSDAAMSVAVVSRGAWLPIELAREPVRPVRIEEDDFEVLSNEHKLVLIGALHDAYFSASTKKLVPDLMPLGEPRFTHEQALETLGRNRRFRAVFELFGRKLFFKGKMAPKSPEDLLDDLKGAWTDAKKLLPEPILKAQPQVPVPLENTSDTQPDGPIPDGLRYKGLEYRSQQTASETRVETVTDLLIAKADERTRKERRLEWLAKAMLLVREHPDWSDARIAQEVGVNPAQLTKKRCPEFQAAAAMARDGQPKRGHVTFDRQSQMSDVEAYGDDGDPAERNWD